MMTDTPINSLALFVATLILLVVAAYGGKLIFKRRLERAEVEDEEAKLVLGALLSFLGLLLGFVLTIAIGGYTDRLATEENEVIAIGSALQRTQLLVEPERKQAQQLLGHYLEARIAFFSTGLGEEHEQWWEKSVRLQDELWRLAAQQAQIAPNSINASVLTAYNELFQTLQRTQANWRHHIPPIAWAMVLAFAFFANGLIGYNIRGVKGENWLLIILPLLITVAFYVIAEIDLPGQGVIHVEPKGLQILQAFHATGG